MSADGAELSQPGRGRNLRYPVPHPIAYQGSKRRLADAILDRVNPGQYQRLVEPFAGSAAVTLAAAAKGLFSFYLIGDSLAPLMRLWQSVINAPEEVAENYEALWYRERKKPIDAFYEIRAEFNRDQDAAKLLYLLARCVKNSVRFNPSGEFNQSPDKRRKGTHPLTMRKELHSAHKILKGRCRAVSGDFLSLIADAQEGDFFYLDPPYQGTSDGKDQRYFAGVSRSRMVEGLEMLNARRVPFILSYDGFCGDRTYGQPLPPSLARQTLLDVGRSSQATLNGRADVTVESLYISHCLADESLRTQYALSDFSRQAGLFG